MKETKREKKSIDLFDAVLIFSIVLIGGFLAFFFLKRAKYVEVEVKITNQNILYAKDNPPSWFTEYFKPGIIAKDSLGRKRAEIKKVFRYDTKPEQKAIYLTLEVKTDYTKGEDKYSYEGKPLIIGAPILLEFPNILAEGLVTRMQDGQDNRQTKEMLIETQLLFYEENAQSTHGVLPFIPEAIRVGDEVGDSLGNTLISIIDKRVESAKRTVVDAFGNVFIRQDPLRKDVYLTLKLKVYEVKNSINEKEYYLFDDVRVKVGNIIPLHLNDISIYPTVTKIIEIK